VKLFHWQILQPRRKHRKNVPRRPKWCAILALFSRGTSAELERRMNRDRPCRSKPGELGESGDRLTRNTSQRSPGPGKHFMREAERRPARRARPDDDREQFGRAQRVSAMRFETLSRAFAAR
jgi:hypothetical protein